MILTNKEMKDIIDIYAKENNLDIKKYDLYKAINWYNWWQPRTRLWYRPASDYTYQENKKEIINKIKRIIYEYEWEEKYGYKGNYDDDRKFCNQCKYSSYKYNNHLLYSCGNIFCTKMSNKYNIPIEVSENNNICKHFKSMFEKDKNLNLEEYFNWLTYAYYVNFKGETTLPNRMSSIIINDVILTMPYLRYQEMDFIKNGIIQCEKYHSGKWNIKKRKYKIQGEGNISIEEVFKLKIK